MALGLCYNLCYKIAMPKPPSSVRSIRLPDETWQWLAEEAARREMKVNGLVSDLLIVGRLKAEEARASANKPAAKPAKTTPKAAPERPAFTSRLKGEWKPR